MRITLSDNTVVPDELSRNAIIDQLHDVELGALEKKGIFVFPSRLSDSQDLSSDACVFESSKRVIRTTNVVGFISDGDDEIQITTRFYNSQNGEDYFLRYMLQKVFNYNVINTKIRGSRNSSSYDLLRYLFPAYLQFAMRRGLYKEYVSNQYNDLNVKGKIDVARHIRNNFVFTGKIAYNIREFSYDNRINEIIRCTIEKLKNDYGFSFAEDTVLQKCTRQIISVTGNYNRSECNRVLEDNINNPMRNGYYKEYTLLQQLCISILKEEKVGFTDQNTKVHGILIDVAWLWEEYLNTLFRGRVVHPQNKQQIGGYSLFNDRDRTVYPDFYTVDRQCVLDAKYKKLGVKDNTINREDLNQITTYLHTIKAKKAGIVYPDENQTRLSHIGNLRGFGGEIFKLSLYVPHESEDYPEFCSTINSSEKKFLGKLFNGTLPESRK